MSATHPTPQLALSYNLWTLLRLVSPGRGISHIWARLVIWSHIIAFPHPWAFRGDKRTRDRLLVCGSQLHSALAHALLVWQQDIPSYWEEMKLKMQVWAHFFLSSFQWPVSCFWCLQPDPSAVWRKEITEGGLCQGMSSGGRLCRFILVFK